MMEHYEDQGEYYDWFAEIEEFEATRSDGIRASELAYELGEAIDSEILACADPKVEETVFGILRNFIEKRMLWDTDDYRIQLDAIYTLLPEATANRLDHLAHLADLRQQVAEVLTTSEIEELYGLAEGTAKKRAQRDGYVTARKAPGAWLVHAEEAKIIHGND